MTKIVTTAAFAMLLDLFSVRLGDVTLGDPRHEV